MEKANESRKSESDNLKHMWTVEHIRINYSSFFRSRFLNFVSLIRRFFFFCFICCECVLVGFSFVHFRYHYYIVCDQIFGFYSPLFFIREFYFFVCSVIDAVYRNHKKNIQKENKKIIKTASSTDPNWLPSATNGKSSCQNRASNKKKEANKANGFRTVDAR